MQCHLIARTVLLAFLISCGARVAVAQVSVDEAERRLQEKLAQHPTTQPSSELERLRAENLKLRERVMSLEQEVTTLKESLARASAVPAVAPGATTKPADTAAAVNDAAMVKPLLGHWRGGDILNGAGFLLTFKSDGTYEQLFTATAQRETGQFRLGDGNTLEMWNDKSPETKRHNQYKFAASPVQLTLTPMVVDGLDIKTPRAMVLAKAE